VVAWRTNPNTRADAMAPGGLSARGVAGRALTLVCTHWIAAVVITAGLVLRVLALVAYHPALLYVDTLKYLYGAWPGADPLGYTLILKPILFVGDLGTVALAQHVLGLAIGVAIYVLLDRRGVPRWLAALAIAPVLLDAYQIQIEQTIMPDVWFEAFAVAGLVLLLWRPEPSVRLVIWAGLILGASATIRQIGEIFAIPALLYLAAAISARRHAMRCALALLVTFAIPIVAYSSVWEAKTGHFQLSYEGTIAGRLAESADCKTLALPADERPICPTPKEQALGIDWLEHSHLSPLKHFPVPAGKSRNVLLAGFDSAVESQQSVRVVGSILRDSLWLFATTKSQLPGVTPISRWRFQTVYPKYLPEINVARSGQIILGIQVKTTRPFRFQPLNPAYGGHAQVDRPIAGFLRAYQLDGGYTPGPLLAIFALAGLAGCLVAFAGRRLARRKGGEEREREVGQLALACLLVFASAVGVLLISDMFEFSWRYQLPALVTLPPAGVLGVWATRRMLAGRSVPRGTTEAVSPAAAEPTPV
jgi:hypothetical protein